MDRQKVALLESLSRKGIVLCRQFIAGDKEVGDKITQVWRDIHKFTDALDSRVSWHFIFSFGEQLNVWGYLKNLEIE